MDVKFVSKIKGVVVVPCPDIAPQHKIRFRKSYTTSDKEEIKKLLSDSFAREKCELAPNQDLEDVSNYLYSEERDDTMTKSYLRSIPFDAWKEIMETRNDISVSFPLVGIAKAELEGKPLTSEIEDIVNKYKDGDSEPEKVKEPEPEVETEEEPVDETEESVEEPEETDKPKSLRIKLGKKEENEATEQKKSTDYNVREARPLIEGAPEEDLEDFLGEDEDRLTILRAWNDRFPDKAVEIPE